MALSTQNKAFLSVLHKLDIDLNQFPDQSFDGLFDNIPEDINYFFEWFIENITSDNILTKLEEANYFELENNDLLPTEEEMEYILSTRRPTYQELQNVDVNYVKSFLSEDLEDIKKTNRDFINIQYKIALTHKDIKNKQDLAMEKNNIWRRELTTAKNNCEETNSLLSSQVDDIKSCLLMPPNIILNLESYKNLLEEEQIIFSKLKNCNLFIDELFTSHNIQFWFQLEEDLINSEKLFTLSRGILESKQAKMNALTETSKNLSSNKNIESALSVNQLLIDKSNSENIIITSQEISVLERELLMKIEDLCHFKIRRIVDQYFLKKADLSKSYITKLTECKNFVQFISSNNLWLLHILLKQSHSVLQTKHLEEECLAKLNKFRTYFSNTIRGFELRKEKYKQLSSGPNRHSYLLNVKQILNHEDMENDEATLRNVMKFMFNLNEYSKFVTHKFRSDIQSSVKLLLSDVLYGPTSQVLHVPVDLLINFHKCEKQGKELSEKIKRLVYTFSKIKKLLLEKDRKILLLWIDFLTNPDALQKMVKESSKASS